MEVNRKNYRWTLRIIFVFVFLVVAHTSLAIYFYRFHEEKPITYTNLPFPIINKDKVFYPGDVLRFTVSRCALNDYRITVLRRIADTLVYELSDRNVVEVRKGCHTVERAILDIPPNFPPSVYHFESEAVVTVRWFYFKKTRYVRSFTEDFTVSERQ